MLWKYCVVVKDTNGDICYWSGFEEYPDAVDFENLKRELQNDGEFSLQSEVDTLQFSIANDIEFAQFETMVEEIKKHNPDDICLI